MTATEVRDKMNVLLAIAVDGTAIYLPSSSGPADLLALRELHTRGFLEYGRITLLGLEEVERQEE